MILRPHHVRLIGEGLDHPECVCVGEDGTLYAGGEAGQIERIDADGRRATIGSTGGFLLGLALDGNGHVHACDLKRRAVFCIAPDGSVTRRGFNDEAIDWTTPNFPVFDPEGRLFVSDSGDYWNDRGTGRIMVIDPDDHVRVFHAGPFRFANGLAIDPDGRWLYIVQSTAPDVVRIPLDQPHGSITRTHRLPAGAVPDGLTFTADGRLVIACYKPDALFIGEPNGDVRLLHEDPTGELLNRPTNVAIHGGYLYVANLGGWHVTRIDTDLKPGPIHRPALP